MSAEKIRKVSFLLSIHIHFIFGFVLWLQNSARPKPKTAVILELLEEPPKEVPKPKVVSKKQKDLQIVESKDSAEVPKDSDADLLSDKNRRHEQETVAKKIGQFKNSASSGKAARQPTAVVSEQPKLLEDSNPVNDFIAMSPREIALARMREGEGLHDEEATSDDQIKDRKKDLETMLNTKQYVYFAYYTQIKKQLGAHWELKIKEKMRGLLNAGQAVPAQTAQITRLFIVLDQNGTLIGVQVLNESGVRDLDDAAVEAFREAAPFPKPPQGIVDSEGSVKIRWDFALEPDR